MKKKVRPFATQFQYSMLAALILMSVRPSSVWAQDDHSHMLMSQHQQLTPDQKSKQSGLLKIVRESTARFKDVKVAEGEGYALTFGCVSVSEEGATIALDLQDGEQTAQACAMAG